MKFSCSMVAFRFICFAPALAAFLQGLSLLNTGPVLSLQMPLSVLPMLPNAARLTLPPVRSNQEIIFVVDGLSPEDCRAVAISGIVIQATQRAKPLTVHPARNSFLINQNAADRCSMDGEKVVAWMKVEPGSPVEIVARQHQGIKQLKSAGLRVKAGSVRVESFFLLMLLSFNFLVSGMLLFSRRRHKY